jgi:hypothetical protein
MQDRTEISGDEIGCVVQIYKLNLNHVYFDRIFFQLPPYLAPDHDLRACILTRSNDFKY